MANQSPLCRPNWPRKPTCSAK